MPRIRTIKPEFPQSESMGRVSRDARLLFILLWTLADDEGRTRASSRMLASLLYPYDDDVPNLIETWLDELERQGCIRRYVVGDGGHYLDIPNWLTHQKIDRPSASKLPPYSSKAREASRIIDADLDQDQGSRIKDQKKETRAGRAVRSQASVRSEFDEIFWPAYPHKVGKPKAFASFCRVRKTAPLGVVMAGLARYVDQKPADRAWLNPATFLNQERFNDEPASPPANHRNGNGGHAGDALFRGLAKAAAARSDMDRGQAETGGGLFGDDGPAPGDQPPSAGVAAIVPIRRH